MILAGKIAGLFLQKVLLYDTNWRWHKFISIATVLSVALGVIVTTIVGVLVFLYKRKLNSDAANISAPPNWADDLIKRSDINLRNVIAADSISAYVRSQAITTSKTCSDVTSNSVSSTVVLRSSFISRASVASKTLAPRQNTNSRCNSTFNGDCNANDVVAGKGAPAASTCSPEGIPPVCLAY